MDRSQPQRWPGRSCNPWRESASVTLYWSAVINGVLAAPLMAMMMLMVTNPRAMGHLTLGPRGAMLGWAATALMAIATLLFFVSLF
jgi:Mn2+/Fe2+ NRAMP family transporter